MQMENVGQCNKVHCASFEVLKTHSLRNAVGFLCEGCGLGLQLFVEGNPARVILHTDS